MFKQPEDADPIDPSEYKIMATYTDHYWLLLKTSSYKNFKKIQI